jgi:glutaredoxin
VLGLVTFLAIFISFKLYLNNEKIEKLDKANFYNTLNSYILIISLASEGFFTGYQAFRLFVPCYFCLIIFAIIMVLSFVKLIKGSKEMIAGFGSFIGVFILFYLVLPVGTVGKVPDGQLTVFYSENCKHCKELMNELEERKIQIPHILIDDNPNFLKNVGIDKVPVLFVNLPGEKRFIIGLSNIKAYIFPPVEKKEEKKVVKKKVDIKKQEERKSILDLAPTSPFLNPPEGVCDETKEDCD